MAGGMVPAMRETMNDRLRRVRKRRYKTARDACEAFGWNENTYGSHERDRGFPWDVAGRYAAAFAVDPWWLLTGEPHWNAKVGIESQVGAGEIVEYNENAPYDLINFMDFSSHRAVAVRGNSMAPNYQANDLILYDPEHTYTGSRIVRRDCVVRLPDARLLLKRVEQGSSAGLWDLVSYNPETATMSDAQIEWASPVTALLRYR